MSYSKNRAIAVEEWSPLLENKFPVLKDNEYKISWLSEYCYNHAKDEQSKSINESFGYGSAATLGNTPGMGSVRPGAAPAGTYSFYGGNQGSGDKFPSTLPMAMQLAARTVGFDIVNVIPLSGPTGVLAYMDYIYGGGKTGTSEQPIAIKLGAENIDGKEYVNNRVYWGTSQEPDVDGNYVDKTKAVEMIFVGYSTIDGFPIFRIGNTWVKNGTTGENWTSDENITLKQIFDTAAAVSENNATTSRPFGTTGKFVATSAKPQLVKALEDHIQGFSGAGTNDQDAWGGPWSNGETSANPMGRSTGENTYYRNMNITAFTKIVEAETFQVAATVTTEQIQDLNKQWGMDVMSMVEGALINEISQSINKHILSRAFALGWTNNSRVLKTEKVTLNFTTDKNNNAANGSRTSQTPAFINQLGFNERLAIPEFQYFGDFENMSTIQRRIKSKILAAGNIIAQRGRRGRANFVVTSASIATSLQDVAQYSFAPMNNTINQQNGALYPIGSVADMTIYVDPTMRLNDTRILVGRKGSDEEPGIKFMPYLMAETISTIAEGTMSPKIAVKSRYALVEAGHHPETQYYTIYCDFGPAGII